MKTVNNTKTKAILISANNYVRAIDQQLLVEETNKVVKDGIYEVTSSREICIETNCINIEFDGNSPKRGTIIIEDSKVKKVLNLEYEQSKKIVYVSKLKGEESRIEEEYIPVVEIVEGMIPVKYDGSNWKVVSIVDNWYDYEKQEWANAVILEDGITKNVGDIVDISSEVKGMFVYIPRYGYKIEGTYGKGGTSQTSPGEIEIMFLSKNQTLITNSEYKEHPAFKFGSEELSGIWVGKFETSARKGSSCYTTPNTNNCNNANQEPYIIPKTRALTFQNVSNQFETAQKFNNYISNGDSHMMKNSEWGAIAYLSQSKYGKYGNDMYSGVNKEVYQNKSKFITGNSNGTPSQDATNDQCEYDDIIDRGSGIGSCGGGASTTGNITGVYDMSGGATEYVMGYLIIPSVTWGASLETNSANFLYIPDLKYYNSYTNSDRAVACDNDVCYGQAITETLSWYGDFAIFANETAPWLGRGGGYSRGVGSGIFCIDRINGSEAYDRSFRITIS